MDFHETVQTIYREAAEANLELAAELNPWFDPSFVVIREGDALRLRVDDESFDDGKGHFIPKNVPIGACDKTAGDLSTIPEVVVTDSTWHYQGDGFC